MGLESRDGAFARNGTVESSGPWRANVLGLMLGPPVGAIVRHPPPPVGDILSWRCSSWPCLLCPCRFYHNCIRMYPSSLLVHPPRTISSSLPPKAKPQRAAPPNSAPLMAPSSFETFSTFSSLTSLDLTVLLALVQPLSPACPNFPEQGPSLLLRRTRAPQPTAVGVSLPS